MLSVRPGMSESEHPIDIDIIEECCNDLRQHGSMRMVDLTCIARIDKLRSFLRDERDS